MIIADADRIEPLEQEVFAIRLLYHHLGIENMSDFDQGMAIYKRIPLIHRLLKVHGALKITFGSERPPPPEFDEDKLNSINNTLANIGKRLQALTNEVTGWLMGQSDDLRHHFRTNESCAAFVKAHEVSHP